MATPDKYKHIDFKPPKSVADAAKKGLEYREKANPSDKGGMTPSEASKQGIGSGVQRATNLKNRDNISPEVIRQMCGFFSRHEKNKGIAPENKSTPWKAKGHVAWLLWGGDPGKTWAEKVRAQMDKADEKDGKTAMLERVITRYAAQTLTPDIVEAWLHNMMLGPAGRARKVKKTDLGDGLRWTIEPSNRQRLDHYVGSDWSSRMDEDDDEEGWDSEAWEEEYAIPAENAAMDYLDKKLGKGLFEVSVDEKGFLMVSLTEKGQKTVK